ncbi:MAG: DUF2484 family protein [Pseudomonadota bacterium]
MSLSMTLACLWVVAAAVVAMLPMRLQYGPGVALLILSLPLMAFVGIQHGWLWVAVVLFAVVSMFRRPLWFLSRRVLGLDEAS